MLERTLYEISSPDHPRYGQHLKREELKNLVKPRSESTAAVLNWLKESGVSSEDIENDGDFINFYAPVARAEEMMSTKFKTYQNLVRKDVKKIRALEYSVPNEVRDHIDLIQPTTYFGQMKAHVNHVHDITVLNTGVSAKFAATSAQVNATCNRAITPACLAELYNFADFQGNANVSTTIGVSGFLEQYARFKDFAQFASLWAPNAVGSNFTWTSVNGTFSMLYR